VTVTSSLKPVLEVFERVPALSSGQPHRIGYAERRGNEVAITQIWGRRVALRPERPRPALSEIEGMERVEALPTGTILETRISLHDVQPEELGGLITALGADGTLARLRLGGNKPVGFGQVRVEIQEIVSGGTSKLDSGKLVETALSKFRGWGGCWAKGLEELDVILSRPIEME
jgi:hypothetical protein